MLLGNGELLSQLRMIVVKMSPPAPVSCPSTCTHIVPNTLPIIIHLSSLTIAISIHQIFHANPTLPGETDFCLDIFKKRTSINIKY